MDLEVDTQLLGAASRSLADVAAVMRLAIAGQVDGRLSPGTTNGSPPVREALSAALLDSQRALELVEVSAGHLAATADSLAAVATAFDRIELADGGP